MKIHRTFSLLLILAFIGNAASVTAQGKENPFDLTYRSKRPLPGISVDPDTLLRDRTPPAPPARPPESMPGTSGPEIDTAAADSATPAADRIDTSGAASELEALAEDIPIPKLLDDRSRRNVENARKTFLFFILLAVALISTLVITYNRQIIQKIWRAIQNDNYLNFVFREQKANLSLQYVFLYLIFFINGGLFLYLSSRLFSDEATPVLLICILFLIGIYAIRHLFMRYLISVYPFKKEAGQFNFTILIFNVFLGLLLLPINAFVTFAPDIVATGAMYAGIGIWAILYILRQLRGILIGINYLLGKRFYFFLYLCAAELAPIFLILKFFYLFIG